MSVQRKIPLQDRLNKELKRVLPDGKSNLWPNWANCSECDAVNQALYDGALWDDIQIHTIKIDFKGNKMINFTRCNECRDIFKDLHVTSDK